MLKSAKNPNSEKGAILFLVAAALVVLLGMGGLAFDLGMLYNVKTDLQNAVDAAALAGAWKLNGTDQGILDAVASAQAAANTYKFQDHPINLATTDITFSTQRDTGYQLASDVISSGSAATIRFVRAGKDTVMDLYMIKVIPGIGSTQNVAAYAVAGQSPPLNVICDGIVPLSPVPQDGDGNFEVYTPGYYYTYRLAPGNDVDSVGAGNYLLLDFCDALAAQGIDCNSGGSTIRDLLNGSTRGCIALNIPICTKPGVTAGPVRQGLNDRFAQDTNQFEYTGGTSVTSQYDRYVLPNDPGPAGNGKRKFVVPFVSTQQGTWAPFDNGKNCPIYILNYGCFFMRERVPGGSGLDIKGEFIGRCNVNGYFDPTDTPPPDVGLPDITKIVLYR
ncbi:MAG: pilus assembly protein TadG-related protein [Acidobacteriota bacterium]